MDASALDVGESFIILVQLTDLDSGRTARISQTLEIVEGNPLTLRYVFKYWLKLCITAEFRTYAGINVINLRLYLFEQYFVCK